MIVFKLQVIIAHSSYEIPIVEIIVRHYNSIDKLKQELSLIMTEFVSVLKPQNCDDLQDMKQINDWIKNGRFRLRYCRYKDNLNQPLLQIFIEPIDTTPFCLAIEKIYLCNNPSSTISQVEYFGTHVEADTRRLEIQRKYLYESRVGLTLEELNSTPKGNKIFKYKIFDVMSHLS